MCSISQFDGQQKSVAGGEALLHLGEVQVEGFRFYPQPLFSTPVIGTKKSVETLGRGRWTPDGRRVIFTGQGARGLDGAFIQDFIPGRDTLSTRRPIAGFDPEWLTESLGLSPDGKRLVLSESERMFSLMVAEGVPGIAFHTKGRR